MAQFSTIYGQILVMFVLIFIGVYLVKTAKVTRDKADVIADLTIDVGFPAMIFYGLVTEFDPQLLGEYLIAPILGILITFLGLLCGYLLAKYWFKLKKEEQNGFVFLNGFSNNIFFGAALILALFGAQGLIITIMYDFGMGLILWSLGIYLLNKEKVSGLASIKKIFSPPLIGLLAGFIVALLRIEVPQFILEPIRIAGNITVPLAMIFIGILLASTKLSATFSNPLVYYVVIIRTVLIPVLVLILFYFLNLTELLTSVIALLAGMPILASSTVLMNKYGADAQLATSSVFISTIIIIFTLPLILLVIS